MFVFDVTVTFDYDHHCGDHTDTAVTTINQVKIKAQTSHYRMVLSTSVMSLDVVSNLIIKICLCYFKSLVLQISH